MKIKGSNKGFSLIELLVVMALITVLAAIGYPAITRQMSHLRLKRDARNIMSELNAARLKAITNNTKYKVVFVRTGTPHRYSLSVFVTGTGWVDEATRPTVELSAGIDIIAPSVTGFSVYFFPNGVATDTDSPAVTTVYDICLSNTSKANDRMELELVNSSGKVTIGTGC